MITCVAPNPSIDKLFEVERLEPGRIHRPEAFVQVPGGKGLNVARAAASLGADVHVVALLGGNTGRWIADEIHALGIPLTAVWHSGETRSCLSVAATGDRSLTEFYESGPPIRGEEWDEFARTVRGHTAGGWTTISGSLPPGVPVSGYRELVAGTSVAIDSTALGDARPAILKVNAAEAEELTGSRISGTAGAIAAAQALRNRLGGEGHAAVLTLGRAGAALATPHGEALVGTLTGEGAYPVGSGDAFLAGLVGALDRRADWPGALRAALGAGAANAEMPGAGRLDPERARALAESARIDST